MDTLRMLWATPHDEAVDLTDLAVVDHAETLGRRHVASLPDAGSRVRAADGGRFVLARDRHDDRDDASITAAVRLDVVETSDDGRRTRTRVRSWRGPAVRAEGAAAWVLVDVEALEPGADGRAARVPEFVPWLLARAPGSCGGVPLSATVLRRSGDRGAVAVRGMLDRHRPVVVLGGLPPEAPAGWVRRVETAAHQTARAVSGLAPVVLVDAGAACTLRRRLPGGGMAVWTGAGPVVDVAPTEVRCPGAAARTALEALRPCTTHPGAPPSLACALERLGPQVPDELVEKMAEVPRDRYPFDPA